MPPLGGTSAAWASESGFLTLLVWEIPDKQLRPAELKPWSGIQQITGPMPWGLQTTYLKSSYGAALLFLRLSLAQAVSIG